MLRMAITLLCHILPTLIVLLLFYGVHDAVAPPPPHPVAEMHMITTPPAAVLAVPEPSPVQHTATPTDRLPSLEVSSLMPSPTSAPSQSGQLAVQGLVGGVPSGLRSLVQERPTSSPGCLTAKCRVYYPSIDLYYWPGIAMNTACLSTIVDEPATVLATGTSVGVKAAGGLTQPLSMVSPSIYVVFPTFTAYDMCGNYVYSDGPSTTKTYNTQALSTLQAVPSAAPATKLFNFSDLPCPPPGIAQQLDLGAAYNPLVLVPESWGKPWDSLAETLNCDLDPIMDPAKAQKVCA